eukprot:c29104_g2_i1 orf=514-2226(+)
MFSSGVLVILCSCVLLCSCRASHHVPSLAESAAVASGAINQPYKTAFHFQPLKNWMNDPNAPMYYKGYYHLFYQYNPTAAYWGNISWGHAVSTDLIHWLYLEEALVPDHWYDINGCWSGSATFLEDGKPAILYTGNSNSSQQMQNLAVPADPSDPLLRKWIKVPQNPVIVATANLNSSEFRDPTTAWIGADGKWRIVLGSRRKLRGLALLYKSPDFLQWEGTKHSLYTVTQTGMWECPDFYPVSVSTKSGLDTSRNGPNIKHVLKVSLDDTKHDHYITGTYLESSDSFVPDNTSIDAGIGLRYDYGKFYASKTFYDTKTGRRILLGWINESDSQADDVSKGWASVQAIPRRVWLDSQTGDHLLTWPVQEVEMLRGKKTFVESLLLTGGSVVNVKGADGAQIDLEVYFDMPNLTEAADVVDVSSANPQQLCSQGGSFQKSVAGPFGLLVLASDDLREQTTVFVYVFRSMTGWEAVVCSDQSRSSLAPNLDITVYGTFVSGDEETLSLRILVDHSIVETFVQGGKACITSRVYPTLAIDEAASLYLFNNGTMPIRVKSLTVWEMQSANLHNF